MGSERYFDKNREKNDTVTDETRSGLRKYYG